MCKLDKMKIKVILGGALISNTLLLNSVKASDIVSEVSGGGHIQSSKLGQGLLNIVRDITGTIQWILPIAAVCLILIYVLKYMAGDEHEQQRCKKAIIKVLVCIVIGLLAVTIVNLIAKYF